MHRSGMTPLTGHRGIFFSLTYLHRVLAFDVYSTPKSRESNHESIVVGKRNRNLHRLYRQGFFFLQRTINLPEI
ncbi:hypothetical protein VTO42DRAFT_66 [Malbranchea cinnamomea]